MQINQRVGLSAAVADPRVYSTDAISNSDRRPRMSPNLKQNIVLMKAPIKFREVSTPFSMSVNL